MDKRSAAKKILKKLHLFDFVKFVYFGFVKIKDIFRNILFPTAMILTYHRVAKTDNDPHQLAVSPENFYSQLEYLKSHYQIISLEQLTVELKNKTVNNKMVVITFDDGYADNLYNALPILEKLNIPVTIFVSSNHIDKEFFYWDEEKADVYNRPLTISEFKEISSRELICIGGHTLSHPHVPTLNKEQKISEIVDDKNKLENLCGKEIKLFSFPFGEFDGESLGVVKDANYQGACILRERRVDNKTDVYRLPRFLVRDWGMGEFTKNLKRKFI